MRDVIKRKLLTAYRHLLDFNDTPEKFALAIASGLVVGIAVPEGFQTVTSVPLAILLRCNIILCNLATFITNPFTVLPLYFVSYQIGKYVTGQALEWNQLITFFNGPSLSSAYNLLVSGFYSFFIGSVIHAFLWGISGYIISYYLIIFIRKRKLSK